MKKLALTAVASSFALALAACGDSGDASEDTLAESVEMPADNAMAGAPDPAADADSSPDAAVDADASAEDVANAEEAGAAAEQAAADAAAAAEAATEAAEDATE
jgi:hypothetical protein